MGKGPKPGTVAYLRQIASAGDALAEAQRLLDNGRLEEAYREGAKAVKRKLTGADALMSKIEAAAANGGKVKGRRRG